MHQDDAPQENEQSVKLSEEKARELQCLLLTYLLQKNDGYIQVNVANCIDATRNKAIRMRWLNGFVVARITPSEDEEQLPEMLQTAQMKVGEYGDHCVIAAEVVFTDPVTQEEMWKRIFFWPTQQFFPGIIAELNEQELARLSAYCQSEINRRLYSKGTDQ